MEKIKTQYDTVYVNPNDELILPDGTALTGRIERFLYAICILDSDNIPVPMSRIEEFCKALITNEIPDTEPQSSTEEFYLAILTGNIDNLPEPISRVQVLLDKLARNNYDISDIEPIQSRYELLLAIIIKNGGLGNIEYVLYEFTKELETLYNTQEKPIKSAILSGSTKYRDIDTGEVLDAFEDGRNLELVSVKMPVLTTSNEDGTKTNILTVNEPIELRGIGDVCDTVDLVTGELVKNTEKFILDGTQTNIVKSSYSNENYSMFAFTDFSSIIGNVKNINILCDNLPNIKKIGSEVPSQEGISYIANNYGIRISILNSKLETTDISGLNKYLSKNPISFVCPITEKSIKTVDLTVADQDGNKISKFKTFNDITYVITESETGVLPEVSIEVAVDDESIQIISENQNSISLLQDEIEETISNQSQETDNTMVAVTEIYEESME